MYQNKLDKFRQVQTTPNFLFLLIHVESVGNVLYQNFQKKPPNVLSFA